MLSGYQGVYGNFTTGDDSAPRILSTSPSNGTVGVGRWGPFEIVFDQPMDPNSLLADTRLVVLNLANNSTVSVNQAGLSEKFSIQWRNDNSVVSLTPRQALRAHTPYRVQLISTSLTSRAGRRLSDAMAQMGQFVTGDL